MATDDKAQSKNDDTPKDKGRKRTAASGLGGAALGAAVGTTVGPVGTLVGAVAGTIMAAGGSTFARGATNNTEGNNKIVLGEGVTRDINGNLPGEDKDTDSDTPNDDTKR